MNPIIPRWNYDQGYATYAPATVAQIRRIIDYLDRLGNFIAAADIETMRSDLTALQSALDALDSRLSLDEDTWSTAVLALNDAVDDVNETFSRIMSTPTVSSIVASPTSKGLSYTINNRSGLPDGDVTAQVITDELVSSNGTVQITTTASASGVKRDLSVQTDGNSLLTDLKIAPVTAGGFQLTNNSNPRATLVQHDFTSSDGIVALQSAYVAGTTDAVLTGITAGPRYTQDQSTLTGQITAEVTRALAAEAVLQSATADLRADTETMIDGVHAVTIAHDLTATAPTTQTIALTLLRQQIGGLQANDIVAGMNFQSTDGTTAINITQGDNNTVNVDVSTSPAIDQIPGVIPDLTSDPIWSLIGDGARLTFPARTVAGVDQPDRHSGTIHPRSADGTVAINLTGNGDFYFDLSAQPAIDAAATAADAALQPVAAQASQSTTDIAALTGRVETLEASQAATSSSLQAVTTRVSQLESTTSSLITGQANINSHLATVDATDVQQNTDILNINSHLTSVDATDIQQNTDINALQALVQTLTDRVTALEGAQA